MSLFVARNFKTQFMGLKTYLPHFAKNRSVVAPLALPTRRYLHQDYYHPHDVPIYQTPSLGGESKTPKLKTSDIIHPYIWLEPRAKDFDPKFGLEGNDFKPSTIRQAPEMFLPEEPTFLEFWGYFPFVTFLVGFLFSHEYLMLMGSGFSTYFLAAPAVLTLIILFQTIAQSIAENQQFRIDMNWVRMTKYRTDLEKMIDIKTQNLKTEKRSTEFDIYVKQLTRLKSAYFSHQRKKSSHNTVLDRLQKLKESEAMFIANRDANQKGRESRYEKEFLGETLQREWDEKVFASLKRHERPPSGDLHGRFGEYVAERRAKDEQPEDRPVAQDNISRTLFKRISDAMSGLKVYKWVAGKEKYVPRDTGLFSALSEAEADRLVPQRKIHQGRVDAVDAQLERFSKGKEPTSLLRMKKKFNGAK